MLVVKSFISNLPLKRYYLLLLEGTNKPLKGPNINSIKSEDKVQLYGFFSTKKVILYGYSCVREKQKWSSRSGEGTTTSNFKGQFEYFLDKGASIEDK